jgi:pSer/pThr/pTyr-binding forkhead associated (FHA) protein
MRARLFAKTGELAGASFEIGDEATLGRTPDNPIVVPSPLISARHSRIFFDPAEACYRLEDLGSRNGTFLDGARLRRPEKLGRLEIVNLAARFDFIFQVLSSESTPPLQPGGGTQIDREGVQLPAGLAPALGKGTLHEMPDDWVLPSLSSFDTVPPFQLRVEFSGGPETFDLAPGEYLVGRGEDCELRLNELGLSRRHARLIVTADRVQLLDLGSTNQTFLEGERLLPDLPTAVPVGAEIRFAALRTVLLKGAG